MSNEHKTRITPLFASLGLCTHLGHPRPIILARHHPPHPPLFLPKNFVSDNQLPGAKTETETEAETLG